MTLKKRQYTPEAKGALQGVRVLDLSRLFAGNLLTQFLGDFGAEVIKVEPPGGDTLRAWQTKGVSTHWKIYARNKKSLCVDLHKPEARDIIFRLLPSASVFVESFRPGTTEANPLVSVPSPAKPCANDFLRPSASKASPPPKLRREI